MTSLPRTRFGALLASLLSAATCAFLGAGTLHAQNYTSPYAITLSPDIGNWTSDIADRGALFINNTLPGVSDWYDTTYAWPQGQSWGPLIPQLSSVPSPAASLPVGVFGPVVYTGPLNPLPPGVSPNAYLRQRLLSVAAFFIGTPYQHMHVPTWNPYDNGFSSNISAPNYWPWSPVSNTPTLSTITGLTIPNPWVSTYGFGTNGIDCSDFAALVYDLALGVHLTANVSLQGNESVQALHDDPAVSALGSVIVKRFINGPNYLTGNINLPGTLEKTVFPYLQPGDLLFIEPNPNAITASHVVIWLGQYGTLADGSNSTVPLIISSHDNTPPVFDLDGNISPPGVHVLPMSPDTWFYQNFIDAMVLVPRLTVVESLVYPNLVNGVLQISTNQTTKASAIYLWGTTQSKSARAPATQACNTTIALIGTKRIAPPRLANLPTLAGSQTEVEDVNAAGQVVGEIANSTATSACTWKQIPGPKPGWTVTVLPAPSNNTFNEALAVNATGVIVGDSAVTDDSPVSAVCWSVTGNNTSVTDLNSVDGNSSLLLTEADAINGSGQIIGSGLTLLGNYTHGFLLANATVTDLGTLGGLTSDAEAINDAGQIVGESSDADDFEHAFLWSNGNMTDLGLLPGGNTSEALAISPSGFIVGQANVASGDQHAVLWDSNGILYDLNTLAPNATLTYTSAIAIDSQGDILVTAVNDAQAQFGVVLIFASNATTAGAPIIIAQPLNATAVVAASAAFTVTANSTAPLTFQWQFTGNNSVTKNIPGATKAAYLIPRVSAAHAGNYSVIVSNTFGTVTSKFASLTVLIPPKIATQPKTVTVTAGGNAAFSVILASSPAPTPPVTYQWQFSNANPATPGSYVNIDGATASSYSITGATSDNQGSYRVLVTGSGATLTSLVAKLTVKPAP